MPNIKGYARKLLGGGHHYQSLYEDFTQTAMLKAWENRHSFVPGTNLKAWLFTILRNSVVTHHRRHWREVVTDQPGDESLPDGSSNPEHAVAARQTVDRIQLLTQRHKDALIDIAWHGLSYAQAAKIRRVPAGTIKSRVARARQALSQLTGGDEFHYGRIKQPGLLGASP
jgi:RNA polymerase sigma-70 factor (ECF subfamily)